ncbi:MAG: hypothetical protein ABI661_01075 [Gammaproteobacteria bacterium]
MLLPKILSIVVAILASGLAGCAQTPLDQAALGPDAAAPNAAAGMSPSGSGMTMARMDEQMKTMRAMHDTMMRATPDERGALMAQHMKVMQESMAVMSGMGSSAMSGMAGTGDKNEQAGMAGMSGKGDMAAHMGMHHRMMERRIEMMQSMMQMMMDRMSPMPGMPGATQ